jgi:hypothetical protein
MRSRLMTCMASTLALLLMIGLSSAAESVRIVQNFDNITAGYNITQQSNGTNVAVQIPAVAISTVSLNSTEYKKVDLPGADYLTPGEMAEEGKPDLPLLTTMIAIPDQAGIQLDVTYSGYDTFENIDIAPVQPPTSDAVANEVIPFTIDNTTYNTDAFYPGELARADEPVIMRDVRGVQIELNPVQYNPVRRELRVYRDLAVSISYAGEPINPKTIHRSYLSDGFYPLYKSMFSNFEQLFSNTEVERGGYVIICKASLVDTLKALAFWKHQKGYSTRIVPTTEINSNGSPTATQIFNYIRTAYTTWEVPPEYVMLVGDIDGALAVVDYPYSTYPSDHHYSCVEGSDFLPDLFVSRLSVDNISQLRIAISKIFKYEKTPLMRDAQHWVRGFSAGYTLYNTARYTTLWVRELALRSGFIQVDTVYGSSHDARVATIMNTGPGFIWYRGEGGADGWWGVDYSISDLIAMPNHQKLGVCTPMTCGLGDFSANECFGETWIRMGLNPDSLKGGPAFFGVSDHFTHTKWNNPIMIGYFFGIFGQNIYHFAAAAVAGKLQDYRTFPRNRPSEVQQYFNTYNMQGDPELELRTAIPILIRVSHPDTIAFGLNHIEVNVVDTGGNAVSDAFVTLIKMDSTTEELYSIGKTDETGNLELSFDAHTPGSILLTVSGQNLYPYEGHIQLVPTDIAVGFDSLAIDDDMFGFSRGNGDSLANPNETIELYVSLRNFGDSLTADNIVTSLTPLNGSLVEVLDGNRSYNNLAPGESRMDNRPYVIHISPNAQDGDIIQLKQTATDQNNDSWFSVIEIPVKAAKFTVDHISIQDQNNRLDPGDTVNMVITLSNNGHANAGIVSASISSEDDFTSIIDANTNFGVMPVGDTTTNAGDTLRFTVDRSAFAGRIVNFTLNTITPAGAQSKVPFTVTVDSAVVSTDPTGPDDYGYYMYDKTDTSFASHPTYNWIELAPGLGGQGTRLNYGSNTDDNSVLVTLPFNFVYYGNSYGVLIVCTNGFVSPDTFRYDMGGHYWADFFNWPIPDPCNCRAQISPFWDDLQVSTTGNNGVFTWSDTTLHRFVIEWSHATHRNTGAIETFEIVIYDPAYYPTLTGDSEILYQYSAITNNDTDENYATVGFESWDQLTGVQYTHDSQYNPGAATITANFAIMSTTNNGRGGIKGNVNLDNGGHNAGVKISASSGQYRTTSDDGIFWLRNLPPGPDELKAEINGYFPAFIDTLTVPSNNFISGADFNMSRCPIPVNLRASDNLEGAIQVTWDVISHPQLIGYDIYRSRWQNNGFVKINSELITSPSYTDALTDTSIYWYVVTAVFAQGNNWTAESFISVSDSGRALGPVGITDNQPNIPKEFFLAQNYPNPFNPTTSISYGLPRMAHVKLEIFNVMGQKALTLVDEDQQAGYKKIVWDGRDQSGKSLSSGLYFYRLRAGDKEIVHKMSLIK